MAGQDDVRRSEVHRRRAIEANRSEQRHVLSSHRWIEEKKTSRHTYIHTNTKQRGSQHVLIFPAWLHSLRHRLPRQDRGAAVYQTDRQEETRERETIERGNKSKDKKETRLSTHNKDKKCLYNSPSLLTWKEVMKSCAKADLAAFSTSAFVAPGLPLSMFSRIVPVNSTGSFKAKGGRWGGVPEGGDISYGCA